MSKEVLVAQTLVKINNLKLAFAELEKHWSENEEELHFLENEYPFDHDFSELTSEVGVWYEYQKEYLQKSFNE